MPRITRGIDEQSTFLLWTHHDGGVSRLRHIRISDGATLFTSPDIPEYGTGAYKGAEALTPSALRAVSVDPLAGPRGSAD